MKNLATKRIESTDQIMRSYNGKVGCMCGCRGTYKANPLYVEEVGKKRGIALSADEISPLAIKRAMNKFNKLIDQGLVKVIEGNDGEILHYENDERTSVIYMTKSY